MSTKTLCDVCGDEIPPGATPSYDLVLKKRVSGFLDAQANVDICKGCLEKAGLLDIIESPDAKVS